MGNEDRDSVFESRHALAAGSQTLDYELDRLGRLRLGRSTPTRPSLPRLAALLSG